MGPTPDPVSSSSQVSLSQQKTPTEDEDIVEKYKTLKRRYEELEEKHKETNSELQKSSERNVKIREERTLLLERILELEVQPQIRANKASGSISGNSVTQAHSGAFPSRLSNAKAPGTNSAASSSQVGGLEGDNKSEASPRVTKRARLGKDNHPDDPMEVSLSVSQLGTLKGRGVPRHDAAADGGTAGPSSSPPVNSHTTNPASPSGSPHDQDSGHEHDNRTEVDNVNTSMPTNESRRVSRRRGVAINKGENDRVTAPTPRRSPRKNVTATDSPVRTITTNHSEAPVKNSEAGPSAKSSSVPSSVEAPSSASRPGQPAIDPSLTGESSRKPDASTSNNETFTNASSSISSSPASSSSTSPGPLSSNPYSIFLTSPPSGISTFNPYANPYLYMASLAAFPGMHLGMPGMHPMIPGTYTGATTSSNSSQPAQNQSSTDQKSVEPQQRPGKPKRLKAHTVTTKNVSIPMVPRDKNRRPMLPLNVGIMTVISLGEVCMREHFHTERYIFPVGYEVTRRYFSTVNPNIDVVYHCTILDGGDGPKFQIVPSDVPDKPIIAGTATGAWSSIVRQANAIRNRQHSNSVSGPDFFGLGQNTIKHLIQELPNADKLRDYVWQNFVEGGPLGGRHAAVIPALPEEYDASMPIGAYYPSAHDRLKRESSSAPEPSRPSHYPPHIMAQQRTTPPGQRPPQQQSPSSAPPPVGPSQIHQPPQCSHNQSIPVSQPMSLHQHVSQMVSSSVGTPNGLNIQNYGLPSVDGGGKAVGDDMPTSGSGPPKPSLFGVPSAPSSGGTSSPVPTTIAGIMNAYSSVDGIPTGGPPPPPPS